MRQPNVSPGPGAGVESGHAPLPRACEVAAHLLGPFSTNAKPDGLGGPAGLDKAHLRLRVGGLDGWALRINAGGAGGRRQHRVPKHLLHSSRPHLRLLALLIPDQGFADPPFAWVFALEGAINSFLEPFAPSTAQAQRQNPLQLF